MPLAAATSISCTFCNGAPGCCGCKCSEATRPGRAGEGEIGLGWAVVMLHICHDGVSDSRAHLGGPATFRARTERGRPRPRPCSRAAADGDEAVPAPAESEGAAWTQGRNDWPLAALWPLPIMRRCSTSN